MDGKVLARLAAVIIIAVAITAAAVHLASDDAPAGPSPSPSVTEAPRADHLRVVLQRCRELGEAATHDPECLAAWDENRRRFLSPTAGN